MTAQFSLNLRTLDLTQGVAGGSATKVLADHGAEVIKVAPPTSGWECLTCLRQEADVQERPCGRFGELDGGGRIVRLDMRSEAGRASLLELIADAEVVVEDLGEGVMDGCGLGCQVLGDLNPRLVYGAMRGFGRPPIVASSDGRRPTPVAGARGVKAGPGFTVEPGAMLAAGVLAAVYYTRRTGEGQLVELFAPHPASPRPSEPTISVRSLRSLRAPN